MNLLLLGTATAFGLATSAGLNSTLTPMTVGLLARRVLTPNPPCMRWRSAICASRVNSVSGYLPAQVNRGAKSS